MSLFAASEYLQNRNDHGQQHITNNDNGQNKSDHGQQQVPKMTIMKVHT